VNSCLTEPHMQEPFVVILGLSACCKYRIFPLRLKVSKWKWVSRARLKKIIRKDEKVIVNVKT
jgi:hypothetical protein